MPLQRSTRLLLVLASALAAAGVAVAGCSHLAPLGPDPVNMPPVRHLGSPIVLQVMHSQPPTDSGQCRAGAVDLFGLALVPRVSVGAVRVGSPHPVGQKSTAAPKPSPGTPVGVACYRPAGQPISIATAAVSSVATYSPPASGPATYGFQVAFPAAQVAAVSAVIKQAYDARAAIGFSVAGKLWQAPQVVRLFSGRGAQITLLSKSRARQLHRLLVPSR
jgi:hypothetical protein